MFVYLLIYKSYLKKKKKKNSSYWCIMDHNITTLEADVGNIAVEQ